jgi:hypothetical protein
MTPQDVEKLVEVMLDDKKHLEARSYWVEAEWIAGAGRALLKWGPVHTNGFRETTIGTREYIFTNGQIVAHTSYHC